MSNWYPNGGSGYPQSEDSLLEVQKRALFKRSYNVVTALGSASRTTSTSTGIIVNPGYKGIMVNLIVTSISAGGLKIQITTGVVSANTVHIDATSVTTASSRTVVVYPGISSSSAQTGSPGVLGPVVLITIQPDTADAITYSVSYTFIE